MVEREVAKKYFLELCEGGKHFRGQETRVWLIPRWWVGKPYAEEDNEGPDVGRDYRMRRCDDPVPSQEVTVVEEHHRAEELALGLGDEGARGQREVAEVKFIEVGGDRTDRFLRKLAHPKNVVV